MSRSAKSGEHDERTRLEKQGWAYFGPAPFEEHIERIAQLVGSHCYEVAEEDGCVFVRRLD